MAITIDVREDGHVLLYTFDGPWLVPELTSLYPKDRAHRDGVSFKVHMLADFSLATEIPAGVLGVRFGLPAFDHSRRGQFTIIGATNYVTVMFQLVLRMANFST